VFADPSLCPPEGVSSCSFYSKRIASKAREIAATVEGFGLVSGVYSWWPGPSYETPLEVFAGANSGAGAFGMSTVPECIVATSLGMEVFALSLCTNLAAGISSIPLSHAEVKEVADKSGPLLMKFMEQLLSSIEPVNVPVSLPPSREETSSTLKVMECPILCLCSHDSSETCSPSY
jgi:purine nucleoside phosphorylase